MKLTHNLRTALAIGVLLGALSACEEPGPLEKAGKNVDKALEESAEEIEDLGEDIEDALTRDGH